MTTFYYSSKAGFRPSGPNPDQSGKVLGAVVRVSPSRMDLGDGSLRINSRVLVGW